MNQVDERPPSREEKKIIKRFYDLIRAEIKTTAPLVAVTETTGFGKTGLVIPFIYKISTQISDFIAGDLCINKIKKLGLSETSAKYICSFYKNLYFLFLFTQMTNYCYMYLFADTPTIFSFISNYGKNLMKLGKDLSFDLYDCGSQAWNEIKSSSKGTGGYLDILKEVFGDVINISLSYIFNELIKISIGFATNIGILTHVNSLGEYIKHVNSTMKQMPKDLHQWVIEWSEWFVESKSAEMLINNKEKVVKEFTDAKTVLKINNTITDLLDKSTAPIQKDNFSKNYESIESLKIMEDAMKDKSYPEMSWIERGWSLLNIKHPMDSRLPIIHESIVQYTNQTYDNWIESMKNTNSTFVKRFANTEALNGGFCKNKIINRLDNFDNVFKNDLKVFDKSFNVPLDYVNYLIPSYEINLQNKTFQIDPTINGNKYNPTPDMIITGNILNLIVVIMVFIQFIILPLLILGKKIVKKL